MSIRIIRLVVLLLWSSQIMAQVPTTRYFSKEIPEKADKELQFFAYFINQGVSSNMYARSEFLKGQVVGRLFGANTTSTSDSLTSVYFEQRIIPFLSISLNYSMARQYLEPLSE